VFEQENAMGIAVSPAPKDLNSTLKPFASFCWHLPDNDMCSRGNSHIYSPVFPDRKGRLTGNMAGRLVSHVQGLLSCSEAAAREALVFYVYAILVSTRYLDEFEGALFRPANSKNPPRIPIVSDAPVFKRLMDVGRRLALLERDDYVPSSDLGNDADRLAATARLPFKHAFENSLFDENSEELILHDDQQREILRLNCPAELQGLNVSGYDVIKNCWMKFHSYVYTRTDFTADDLRELVRFLNSLQDYLRISGESDSDLERIFAGNVPLFSPTRSLQ
jgi:hypothetical protein